MNIPERSASRRGNEPTLRARSQTGAAIPSRLSGIWRVASEQSRNDTENSRRDREHRDRDWQRQHQNQQSPRRARLPGQRFGRIGRLF